MSQRTRLQVLTRTGFASRRVISSSIPRLAADSTEGSTATPEAPRSSTLVDILRQASPGPSRTSPTKDATAASGAGSLWAGKVSDAVNPKPFRAGTIYNPSDLLKSNLFPSQRRMPKPPLLGPPAAEARKSDPFHILGINPIDEALNANLVQKYVTQMGKIKSRADTALTWKNQRRVGKMVRRARAMGLISRWNDGRPL